MTFRGNIVYLRPCSVICANDTTRAQINNIPSKSHVIPLLVLPMLYIFLVISSLVMSLSVLGILCS